jgi:hypothetical protein
MTFPRQSQMGGSPKDTGHESSVVPSIPIKCIDIEASVRRPSITGDSPAVSDGIDNESRCSSQDVIMQIYCDHSHYRLGSRVRTVLLSDARLASDAFE